MKKACMFLMISLAVVALLLSAAMAEETEHTHYATCGNPEVCAVCGKAYAGDDIRHGKLVEGESLGKVGHRRTCEECGGEWIAAHERLCTKLDECYLCGEPLTEGWVRHGETHTAYDGKAHWLVCDDCGEDVSERGEHFAHCDAPGVCQECGEVYSGEVIHTGPTHYEADEDTHWLVCDGCREAVEKRQEHAVNCATPDWELCHICGEEYTGSNRYHSAWQYNRNDPEAHWKECRNCRERLSDPEPHRISCDNPNACCDCDAHADGISKYEADHPYTSVRGDLFGHWQQCTCGEVRGEKKPHDSSPLLEGWCPTCDTRYAPPTSNEYENGCNTNNRLGKLAWFVNGELREDFSGFVRYNGAAFYLDHGVLFEALMGPALVDGVWYAFDAGRVMPEEMLVPYDGGVFAFKNGTLDTSRNGLVEFNGEKFVFALGQFQSEVFGAWLDPLSNRWVYVWYGQYYEITDLVSYDGEIFYFIDGELATNFTGVVEDFQGTQYHVVNGQVQ